MVAALVLVPRLMRGPDAPPVTGAPIAFRSDANQPIDRLIAKLQDRIKENPNDFGSHINLANGYLQKARESGDPSLYTKTGELLDQAAKLDAQNPELFATQASLALARHDFAGALKLGKQALVLDTENHRYYGILGDAQIELGMYDQAVRSYQDMIDRRPEFTSYARVSHARELHGDTEGAIQSMEFAINAGSTVAENSAWAYVQLGNLYYGTNNPREATTQYENALRRLPNYAPALAGKARVAVANGNLQGAAALYKQAFDRMPLAEYAIALGDVYTRLGDSQAAAGQYELVKAINTLLESNGVNTDLELALFYADHDLQLKSSVDKARAAYAARPTIYAADALAWTLYKNGDLQEAWKYAQKSTAPVSPSAVSGVRDSLLLYHAGTIAKALGHKDLARQYLFDAVRLNPHFSLLYSDDAEASLEELGPPALPTVAPEGRMPGAKPTAQGAR